MSNNLELKEYVDLKTLSQADYSLGLLLSLKLLIANLTISGNMNTQGYIDALKTAIKELSDVDINPTVLVAPKNILKDLEELVAKLAELQLKDNGENCNE